MRAASDFNLLLQELQVVYSAETQLLAALPQMAEAASSNQLRAVFEQQREEIKLRVIGIEKVFADWNANSQDVSKAGSERFMEDSEPQISDLLGISAMKQLFRHTASLQ